MAIISDSSNDYLSELREKARANAQRMYESRSRLADQMLGGRDPEELSPEEIAEARTQYEERTGETITEMLGFGEKEELPSFEEVETYQEKIPEEFPAQEIMLTSGELPPLPEQIPAQVPAQTDYSKYIPIGIAALFLFLYLRK